MDCYIFDAIRTPRGRGKNTGALHEVTPIELIAQTLRALRDRNQLDTATVDATGTLTATFQQWQINDDQGPPCAPQFNEEANVAISGHASHHFGDGIAAVRVQ